MPKSNIAGSLERFTCRLTRVPSLIKGQVKRRNQGQILNRSQSSVPRRADCLGGRRICTGCGEAGCGDRPRLLMGRDVGTGTDLVIGMWGNHDTANVFGGGVDLELS